MRRRLLVYIPGNNIYSHCHNIFFKRGKSFAFYIDIEGANMGGLDQKKTPHKGGIH